jgi:hypothetical protein
MISKTARQLIASIAAATLTLAFVAPATAANPSDMLAPLAGSYAKLTNVEVGVFDGSGTMIATCYTNYAPVKNGAASFSCDFSGDTSGAELIILDADQGQEAFGVTGNAAGKLSIKNLDAGKAGWFSVDIGSGTPDF